MSDGGIVILLFASPPVVVFAFMLLLPRLERLRDWWDVRRLRR